MENKKAGFPNQLDFEKFSSLIELNGPDQQNMIF